MNGLPELAYVEVDRIATDSAYQRELDERRARKMAGAFDWCAFGAVVLRRDDDGGFFVTDGQHRVAAAQLAGIAKVPAVIMNGHATPDGARDFLSINRDRRNVTSIEKFWAGLAAEDPACVQVRDVCARAGVEIAPDSGCYKPGMTNAVGALMRAVQRYGEKATRLSLETIREAWPSDHRALRGTMISALARLHELNGGIDRERLVRVLSSRSLAEMTAHAENFRKLSGGSAESVLARAVAELYNRGLSANIIYWAGGDR